MPTSIRTCRVLLSLLCLVGPVLVATPARAQLGRTEPLGQSSRRTSLVISEIHYNPLDRADGLNLEFVELYNALSTPEDISGWRLDGSADFTFPPNTILAPGAFLVVAQSPADLGAVYSLVGVLGPFANTNSLPNTRGTIQLRNPNGAVFLEANYDSAPPWPAAADGAGHSLVLARPSYGEANVEAWAASDSVGGSPGRAEPLASEPLRNVVINEFLANTESPSLDFIELYNHSTQTVDVSGCSLSDARNTNKFVLPPGAVLPPRGFLSFNQEQLGFALSSAGESIYLRNPARTRVLDAIRFGAQAAGVASGRCPDGAGVVSELASPTPGSTNRALLARPLVINEILYHPVSGENDDEFVELHNRGGTAINLAGWRLEDAVDFTFPPGASVPAGGYIVVARNQPRLLARYANLTSANTVGNYSGALGDGGERIVLTMPEAFLVTNNAVITTNYNHVRVDEVTYRDGGRWGRWSDGGGSSLELIDARADRRLADNWADSDETRKAPWTTVSVRGVLDNGTSSADQLQVLLLGSGECLLDDVEVLTSAGLNLVTNSTFEAGASGWTAEGTLEQSGWESGEGFASAASYRVRASERGDNQVNRIRTPLRAPQSSGATNTIRAKVRWLRGHPELLFRLRGNWLEAAVTMDLPPNPGTPGAANSRAVVNARPAISGVTHAPPVPAANEAVLVTARVSDPDGLGAVQLRYRLDPSPALTSVAMVDDGTGGDAVAGDGVYSAVLPGQGANTLVAFHVSATDAAVPGATGTFPHDAPAHEGLVRFGETVPAGSFPSYRIWMTQASFNAWDTRNNLNNTLNDVTLVFGNHRVIYNAGAAYAGSPYIGPSFTTPTGNRCGYTIELPSDDPFLGDTALVLDWPGGHGGENTAIQEQMAYYIADRMGIAFSHRYFIRLTVNGVTDLQRGGVFEAVLQPGSEFLKQWSPGDSDGDFFKIDRSFEFSDAGALIADPEPQLRVYSTPDLEAGGIKKKLEKYRWYWQKRSFDRAHDYTNLFVAADVLNAAGPEPYTSQTEALIDVEQWMGIFAAEHIINNFDSWGHDIGKNMYMFKPESGRWQIYMFDLDWLMLVAAGSYPPQSGGLFVCDDPTIARMYAHPPFRRAYFRAVQKAVERAFDSARYEPLMDAKYAALVANGITLCDGQPLANPTAVKTWFSVRRSFLVNQLSPLNVDFAITSNSGNDFTTDTNVITLTGTAPVRAQSILVNGVAYPVRWTSVTNWSIRVPLSPGDNTVTLSGRTDSGQVLTNLTDTIRVTSTATPESPVGRVVINEIMYRSPARNAGFVEIYNNSASTVFDLSGWRLNGVDYTFPGGTLLDPRSYVVLAESRDKFGAAYGGATAVSGEFNGGLDGGGETLTLIQPGAVPEQDLRVATVSYDDDPPWPSTPNGQGPSLQLIDPNQDNARVANWSDGSGWRQYSFTGTNAANATNFMLWLAIAGSVHLDDVSLVEGPKAGVGLNLLENGGFENQDLAPWRAIGNHSNSVVTTSVARSGRRSLHLVASGTGGFLSMVGQALPLTLPTTNVYTLSFNYLPSTSGTGLNFRVTNPFRAVVDYRPMLTTPGAPNGGSLTLTPFPKLWINEVQPVNVSGAIDNAGEHEPWLELINTGTDPINLEGWFLTDSYSNLTRWPFPPGAAIDPGELRLVWLDGEAGESSPSAWHAGFRIPPSTGSVAVVYSRDEVPTVLDYVNYRLMGADQSLGFHPDGQAGPRLIMARPTPGAANELSAPLPSIVINEWMASNTSFLIDPTDGTFDDWFELYNAGPTAVDLTGYSLADRVDDRTAQWRIPAGHSVPANGFLLVWADEDPGQNGPTEPDLHAGFKLSQPGEDIALFAPDGRLVDAVRFTGQTNNISQGRWPDGAAAIHFMPAPTPRAANRIPGAVEVRLLSVQVAPNGDLQVTWSAEPGRRYRVQFKNDLAAAVWTDFAEVTAASTTGLTTIPDDGSPQRFVRVQQP